MKAVEPVTPESVSALFGPSGGLAQVFPNFEVRQEQIQMARAVEDALGKGRHLLIEAGTGVGKSLAYLAPAAEWASTGQRRVVISTHTKVLQNQLVRKDIPLLQQIMGGVRAEPVFGQENYLCRRRLAATITHGLFDTPGQARDIEDITDWAATSNGILIDYPSGVDSRTIARIGRNSDNCLYKTCPYREECFYFQARERWAKAGLLIINHYLYFANAGVGDRLLPHFDSVIFDEAHRLEDVCARHFGSEVSSRGLDRLFNSVHNPTRQRGIINTLQCSAGIRHNVIDLLKVSREASRQFFGAIRDQVPAGAARLRVRKPAIAENVLDKPLALLSSLLKELSESVDDEDLAGEVTSLLRNLELRRAAIASFLTASDPNSVYWVETAPPEHTYLSSALIDVAEPFRSETFAKRHSVVLTSATLTTGREFGFLRERLGAGEAATLLLDSPFDYEHNVMLYVDPRLPPPGDSDRFLQATAQAIDELLQISRGRALVLFTSYDSLQRTYQLVDRGGYRFLAQGDASPFELLNAFKTDVSSVLFATQSFWEGIDVPGEALSCLVIVRLPFEVPDDPRLEGIAESLRAQGREPFNEYQLPQAVLRFRQGFGRLVRSKTDTGIVSVLDSRIVRRSYGRAFLSSLPPGLPVVRSIEPVRQFMGRAPAPDR